MMLRTLSAAAVAAGVSVAAGAAATCRAGAPCAAADAADMGDSPSLLQAAPRRPGKKPRHPHKTPGGDVEQEAGREGFLAGDDEDKDAELIGVAREFEPHPAYELPSGYEEGFEVFGEAWVTASKGRSDGTKSQRLFWNLIDVDPRCAHGPDARGSCSIKFFPTNPCSGPTTNGPPSWYNREARAIDPWEDITYTAAKGEDTARSKFSRRVESGLSAADLRAAMGEGLTVAVFDFEARVMACAPITSATSRPAASMQRMAVAPPARRGAAAPDGPALVQQACSGGGACQAVRAWHFKKLPGADIDVWGRVLIYEIMGEKTPLIGQYVTFDFEEVDGDCHAGPSGVAFSCGLRITEGTSCEDVVETELWKGKSETSYGVLRNPWQWVGYTSVKTTHVEIAQGKGVAVLTGYDSPEILGKTLLVYDYKGRPAACAVLEIAD